MQELTERQATYLSHTIHEIRNDWPVPSLMSLFGQNRDITCFGALVVAAATKAMDPTCRTPAPIFHPGDHWPGQSRARLSAGPPCQDHETESAHNCRCCWSDVRAGQRPRSFIGKHHIPQQGP